LVNIIFISSSFGARQVHTLVIRGGTLLDVDTVALTAGTSRLLPAQL